MVEAETLHHSVPEQIKAVSEIHQMNHECHLETRKLRVAIRMSTCDMEKKRLVWVGGLLLGL